MAEEKKEKKKFQFERGQYDDDHIFDEELQMVNSIREACKDVFANWPVSDRFIVVFLIARKHDLTRTEKLIRDHFEWREKWGFKSFDDTPRVEEISHVLIRSGQQLHTSGTFDKQGRKLLYKFSSKMLPSDIQNPIEVVKYVIWSTDYGVKKDKLFFWRQGVTVVQDMKDFGMKHMSFRNQDAFKNLHDVMPFRPQAILTLNAGILLPILLKIGKAFIRAKIIRRIKTINEAELKDYIDPEHLLDCYDGGKLKFDQAEWYDKMVKKEKRKAERKKLAAQTEPLPDKFDHEKTKKKSKKSKETGDEPAL